MRSFALALCAFALASPAYAKTISVAPGADAQEALQLALLDAQPGDVVELAAGRFELTDGLSLDVDGVTIKGAGPDITVLSFDNQQGGAEGLLITSDKVTVRDFAVENSKGDGVKSKDADQISMINLRVEWTGGPKATNGAYGVYPVGSTNVLIDGVTVRGASDAGVYVGQSKNIIGSTTKNCHIHFIKRICVGSPRPSARRIFSLTSGGTVSGTCAIGSPGASSSSRNITRLMKSSVGIARTSRRIV